MTTPRAMARHVFYSQRPQGLRKTHAVMRGGTAVVMVGSKEGNGVQDKRRGDEKGAAKGETAAMISRPPGRRPSQALVDIGPRSSDRMMSIPPGRRPSQVLVDIRPRGTAAMISRPPGRRPSQVLVDIGPRSSDKMMSIPPGRRPSRVMAVIMLAAEHDGGQVVRGSAAQGSHTQRRSIGGPSRRQELKNAPPGRGRGGSGRKARSSGEGKGGGSKGNPPIAHHGQMPEAATR